jgi:hypothetical protein
MNIKIARNIALLALAGSLAACAEKEAAQQAGPVEPDELICGVEHVEDMVQLPGTPWIVGSGIGGHFFQSGGLHLINEDEGTAKKLELDLSAGLEAQAPYDQCPGPAAAETFSAHGIALAPNGDGAYRLYAVNHGGRESIEVFDIAIGDGEPTLTWAGCVLAPNTSAPNAVAARADGSLVLSASSASDKPMPSFAEMAASAGSGGGLGEMNPQGSIYIWTRADGWTRVPGSELEGNNGIELSKDGKWAWNNSWPGSSVTLIPLDPELGVKRAVELPFKPDNIRWSEDGKLIVAGHLTSQEEVAACALGDDPKLCAIDYKVAEIDPETFEVTELFHGKGTGKFGVATIGVKTGKNLWLGSVRSQCIGRVALKQGR